MLPASGGGCCCETSRNAGRVKLIEELISLMIMSSHGLASFLFRTFQAVFFPEEFEYTNHHGMVYLRQTTATEATSRRI